MNIHLIADPSTIWISEATDPASRAGETLRRVISWLKLASRQGVSMGVDIEAATVLYKEGLVPSDRHISSIITKAGCDGVVNAQELSSLLNQLVIASFDSQEKIQALASFTKLDLAISADVLDVDKAKMSEDSFLCYCLLWGTSGTGAFYVYPRVSADEVLTRNEVKVDLFEIGEADLIENCMLGVEVPVFGSDGALYASLDARAIWSSASNAEHLVDAVKALVSKERVDQADLKNFSFGNSFLDTARRNGGIAGPIGALLLNKIFKIVSGSGNIEISDFRTSAKQTAPAVVRTFDSAVAKRVHLTGGHEGYRLLFWELQDGSLEFANVGPKFENKIFN